MAPPSTLAKPKKPKIKATPKGGNASTVAGMPTNSMPAVETRPLDAPKPAKVAKTKKMPPVTVPSAQAEPSKATRPKAMALPKPKLQKPSGMLLSDALMTEKSVETPVPKPKKTPLKKPASKPVSRSTPAKPKTLVEKLATAKRSPVKPPAASTVSIPVNGDLWPAVQADLRQRMSLPSYETWISPLSIEKMTEQKVTLRTDSDFNRDQILKRYRGDLKEAFAAALGRTVDITIIVVELTAAEAAEALSAEFASPVIETQRELPGRPWTPRTTASNLNPKYTFEAFVVGEQNRFCHAAALAVAESPAQSYNPFFIYGGVGLGKTHLMQAIGHFALQHHQDLVVRYVTAEQFTNDMISALGRKDMKGFQNRYRKNDILIIDDVQFLEGKVRTQEEVFHTFNALHEAGKQVILSSDRSPKHLSNLEDRLRSRFEWGLIADIQPADYETRLAILQKKAEREKLTIPMPVLSFIAESNPNNIRELEGALNKVAAYGMLTRTPIDLNLAQNILGTPVDKSRMSLEDILEAAAGYYHLRPMDLKSPSRAKDVSHARQVSIYLIRTMTEASFPKIGEFLGGRKHTTILYAFEKIKDELETHPVLKQQMDEIKIRVKKTR